MRWDLGNQWLAFANSFWQGAVFAVVFDFFRVIRVPFRWRTWELILQDVGYWVFISFWAFVFLLQNSDGVLRWYVLLGWTVGWVIWYETAGRLSLWIVKKMHGFLRKTLAKIKAKRQKRRAERKKRKLQRKQNRRAKKAQRQKIQGKSKKINKKLRKRLAKSRQDVI